MNHPPNPVAQPPSVRGSRLRILALALAAKILYAGIILVVLPGLVSIPSSGLAAVPLLGVLIAPIAVGLFPRSRLLASGAFILLEASALGSLPGLAAMGMTTPALTVFGACWMASGLLLAMQLAEEVTADDGSEISRLVEVMVPALLGGVLAATISITSDETGHVVAVVASTMCAFMILAMRGRGEPMVAALDGHE